MISFDLASRTTVTWSVLGSRIAGIAALVAGLVAWLHVVLWAWRTYRWRGLVAPIAWAIVGVIGRGLCHGRRDRPAARVA